MAEKDSKSQTGAKKPATTASTTKTSAASTKANATTTKSATTPAKPATTTSTAKTSAASTKAKTTSTASAKPAAQKTAASVTTEKKTAPAKAPEPQTSGGGNFFTTVWNNKTYRIIAIVIAAVFLAGILALCIALPISCNAANKVEFVNAYKTSTAVGYKTEYLGTVNRKVPTAEDVKNEGRVATYPTYGKSLGSCLGTDSAKVALRNALIGEASYLTATGTKNAGGGGYNCIDSEGYLHVNGIESAIALDANNNQRKLYKHTAAEGMYMGNVADDEPAVVKRITMRPRNDSRGYSVTGLYAPAGEVVKVEISASDMEATGGLTFYIGQALYNGKANNIWADKNQMQRMPIVLNTLVVNKNTATLKDGVYTAYVGNFLGGPIYIGNTRKTFTVTISGAVRYSHFILGFTTPEEFAENAKSSAPYFDLEVWDAGVLHSGPNAYAKKFSYDELYDAAILWDKIANVSTMVSTQGIVFLYDPFVAAGAAVAFPGQGSVNCPTDWMTGSLDYKAFINSGTWGNMHEYNHNFQGWGIGDGGEVTNNALTLVEYSLFTRISQNRKLGSSGDGLGGGWNSYTSAPWALDQITAKKFANGAAGLAGYATILHNFGQDAFMKMIKNSGGQSPNTWLKATTSVSHYNFSYYINDMLGFATNAGALTDEQKAYPMFVPVSSIYQTGRAYNYDGEKRYITTMQPYVIEYGADFTVDLRRYATTAGVNAATGMYSQGSVVLPNGFSYTVKNVSQPEHGSIRDNGDGTYTYTPDKKSKSLDSGKIYVTLGITKDDSAFSVDDVELVFEFRQSHEMNKNVLERTVYTFSEKKYDTVVDAYNANFAGATSNNTADSVNKVQNSNADIWLSEEMPDNSIAEIKGKIYVEEAGKYRLALRGRWNCALYYSVGKDSDYKSVGSVHDTVNKTNTGGTTVNFMNGSLFNDKCPYVDLDLQGGDWVYFKEYMGYEKNGSTMSYIGIGWGKFETLGGTIEDNAEDKATEATTTLTVGYPTAYRSTYEQVVDSFDPPYFRLREYSYSYSDENYYSTFDKPDAEKGENFEIKLLSTPTFGWSGKPEYMFDGNTGTHYHSNPGANESPIEIKIDMGRPITVNTLNVYSRNDRAGTPKQFILYVSDDNVDYRKVGEFLVDKPNSTSISVNFDMTTFRYFSLYVTDTNYTVESHHFLIISQIQFSNSRSLPGGVQLGVENNAVAYRGKWDIKSDVMSTFGKTYYGNKKASAVVEFEGKRFGILSAEKYGANFEVRIDGKKVEPIELRDGQGEIYFSFITPELTEGKHTAEVTCKGKSSIDSFVYWK